MVSWHRQSKSKDDEDEANDDNDDYDVEEDGGNSDKENKPYQRYNTKDIVQAIIRIRKKR